jgi:diguanylate cyclase (GGDEF)-like protein
MLNRKNQIVLLISLLLVAGFLATSLASYFTSLASLRKEIDQNALPLTSDNIYSEIQRDLLRPIFISSLMASDTFLRDWVLDGERDPERMTRYLREIQTRYNTFTCFFVSERTRTYYHSSGILKQVRPDEERDTWYFRVRTMEMDHEINVDPDMANRDTMTIFINYKVYDYAGNYLGATGVGLTVNAVKSLIETYQRRYQRDIYFVDRQGNVMLSGDAFSRGESRLQEMPGLAPLTAQILGADLLTLSYKRDGETIHLNTRFIKEFDWHLLVEQPEAAAIAGIRGALFVNLGICALVTAIVVLVTCRSLSAYQQRIEDLAATDKLTGAYNRKAFDHMFEQARVVAERNGKTLSMLILDLDHFKKVNDSFGHQAGDAVLKEVAQMIRASIRETDLFFRFGGEEFLIVLTGCQLANAGKIAEKIRSSIHRHPLRYEKETILMTASFGVAEYLPGEDVSLLIRRADQALYEAKENGRNRTEIAATPVVFGDAASAV